MAPVVVVGAGIAGVACARALQVAVAGAAVRVLERGQVPGGRMASRRHGGRPVDIGAAYFTIRDAEFTQQVASWERWGLVRRWTDTFAAREPDGNWRESTGPDRWAAPGGLHGLVTDLADGLDVRCGHTVRDITAGPRVDGEPAAAVVLAMPDPQAVRLLDPALEAAAEVRDRPWEPALVLTAEFTEPRWRPLRAAFVNGHDVLALVADDGDRRGDGAPVLVAHSTAAFAASRLDDPAAATPELLAAVQQLLGPLGDPGFTHVHRWSFARPVAARDKPFHLDCEGIGLAGDGWGSPRVETAWRSGTLLGRALAARLG
ncbi:MAG: NAD(P)/FAD-dependent oxidoreductase [Pseudonocardiaceae bacterium]